MDCLFCEFISGKRKCHDNVSLYGKRKAARLNSVYEIINVIEDKYAFAFLTPPNNLKEHELIVIPKKHCESFEDLSKPLLTELILEIQKIVRIIRLHYGDCKILLNNGLAAEQYIPHVHFHLIVKDKNQNNLWRGLRPTEHMKLSLEIQKKLKNRNRLESKSNDSPL